MNEANKNMTEILEVFKEEYKSPTKIWLWGKATKEWIGIVLGGFFVICLFLFFVMTTVNDQKRTQTPIKISSEEAQRLAVEQTIIVHLKQVIKFVNITETSVRKRQALLQSFMEALALYANSPQDQKTLEQKLSILSTILETCTLSRSRAINSFSKNSIPFDILKTVESFICKDEFFRSEELKFIDPQKETEEWGKLCELCQDEVKRTQNELVKLLEKDSLS